MSTVTEICLIEKKPAVTVAEVVEMWTLKRTRSSPQWWSGCSTTTHIVLDLLSLIWGLWPCFWSLHHFTTSQCVLKCVLLTFSLSSNRLAAIWNRDFSGFLLAPRCLSRRFELFSWLQKPFGPPDPDTTTNTNRAAKMKTRQVHKLRD